MKFWKELIWIVTSVVLLICVLFLGIKLIRIENNQDEWPLNLNEAKIELYEAIAENYADLDVNIEERIAELTQYLNDKIAEDVAAEIALVSQQLSDDLDEDIDAVIQYLDGITDENMEDIIQYLGEVRAELRVEIDANYTSINEGLDEEIEAIFQYLDAEIDRLYNDFVDNYEINKEYTDSRILLLEYLINLICGINGLALPPAYTPPDFSEFE
ncbi:hypothetical protein ACFLYS_01460 [Chloroflexota bacterium]